VTTGTQLEESLEIPSILEILTHGFGLRHDLTCEVLDLPILPFEWVRGRKVASIHGKKCTNLQSEISNQIHMMIR
jgi:hypothetical protein